MTWISRLLPQSPSQHPANHNHRSRQAQRRRRMATLETLEGRTLLSNVTVSFAGGALTILGDAHNDSFSITEQSAAAGGKVTVTSTSPQTTINKTSVPFVSPQAVTSIVVRLPGTTNSDTVSLLGAGKTTPTTVTNVTITGPVPTDLTLPIPPTAANLTFTANGVDNINGAFRLSAAALLTAHVDNSSFHTVVINQEGDSKAVVELGNNMIPGPADVHEGYGNKDSITVDNGNLSGHTELYQGWVGDLGLGTADSVTVTNATTGNLDIEQLIDGTANTINVNTVSVALNSYGVTTTQGNGAKDTTTINLVTTPTPLNPLTALGKGPPSIAVAQGDGTVVPAGVTATGNDSASVTNSTLWGGISITQADVAGNAKGDSATISGDTLGFTIPVGPYVLPVFGVVTITQGNAPGDTAVLDQDVVNNVSITQGDNVQAPNGTTVVSDVAEINDTSVTSNINITQGGPNAGGGYVAAIGSDYLGDSDTSTVTAGNDTSIYQYGANNTVYLGDPGGTDSFTTGYLDVFTGAGGGGFVQATNTTASYGALAGHYTIDGRGHGNTYFDNGGNTGITISPRYHYTS